MRRRLGRLPQRADFLRLQAKGRKQVTPAFILQAGDRPSGIALGKDPRVGFTVTKKIGNAVIRNRVRRRLRALAREILVPVARFDLDYVLIGRHDALRRDYAAMADDLRRALRRLKAENPESPA
ncbi:ribonuclease P protein component [Reyranella sp. CPCC 100927]|uniref:ribonuclease P protein component n=1 Tax=Reyranella sp. CPCC 100927 TaxID=2599616 RepID=UPI0011B63565|nr:ribonuclease P protein component [Reyranella sp. CPCC 100927]TWT15694.1 ribonuclease P protein component [Reyranella sp. CPCC 100927]